MGEKPRLHWSHMETALKCGHQFALRYREGLRVRPGVAMVVGTTVHKAAAANLTRKAETGDLMSREELHDTTRDALSETWTADVELLPEEIEKGEEETLGRAVDKSLRLADVHAAKIAPMIRPHVGGIERSWVVEAEGYPFDLEGEMDVYEKAVYGEDGTLLEPSAVRDLKTSKNLASPQLTATSGQLSMYALAAEALEGALPDRVYLDYTVDRASGAIAGSFWSVRRPEHIVKFWRRLERLAEVIEHGTYLPSRPYVDWWCSEKWCGYARINPQTGEPYCRFFSVAPVFVALDFHADRKQPTVVAAKGTDAHRQLLDEL